MSMNSLISLIKSMRWNPITESGRVFNSNVSRNFLEKRFDYKKEDSLYSDLPQPQNIGSLMPEIQHTSDHQNFQLISCNRDISEKHVSRLSSDPDFAKNIEYHPIIVNEKMQIIDGQHRYLACRKLGIPIPFIIQEGACLKDIMRVNVNQKRWDSHDFLGFYAKQSKQDYLFIQNVKERYTYPLYLINTICRKFDNANKNEYNTSFKEGTLKISSKTEILEFCDFFIPRMKELKQFHDKEVSHLFTLAYTEAFIDIYRTKRDKFDKLMYNLDKQVKVLTGSDSVSQCRELILKAADKRWR